MLVGLLLSIIGHLVGCKTTMRPSELHVWFERALWWHLIIAYSGFGKSAGYNVLKTALREASDEIAVMIGVDHQWFYTSVSHHCWLFIIMLLFGFLSACRDDLFFTGFSDLKSPCLVPAFSAARGPFTGAAVGGCTLLPRVFPPGPLLGLYF
jgi:hypothetical protein